MKTTVKISAFTLMLVFAVSTAFASSPLRTTPPSNVILHQVNIVPTAEKFLCGSYVVELRNQFGQLVAQPKNFVPGQNTYYFAEKFDGVLLDGVRTAMLKQITGNGLPACTFTLHADPATLKTTFETGKTYYYDLILKMKGRIQ